MILVRPPGSDVFLMAKRALDLLLAPRLVPLAAGRLTSSIRMSALPLVFGRSEAVL